MDKEIYYPFFIVPALISCFKTRYFLHLSLFIILFCSSSKLLKIFEVEVIFIELISTVSLLIFIKNFKYFFESKKFEHDTFSIFGLYLTFTILFFSENICKLYFRDYYQISIAVYLLYLIIKKNANYAAPAFILNLIGMIFDNQKLQILTSFLIILASCCFFIKLKKNGNH